MKEIFVRLDRCVSCHSCELACAVEHSASKSLFAAPGERPSPRQRLYVEYVAPQKVPLLCRHCEDAPCVRACRTGAMSQSAVSRVVSHDPARCIGCWMCTMVCPYGVIGRRVEERIAVKCDRCPDRDAPACVDACPTHALVFAEEEGFSGGKRAAAARLIAEGYLSGQAA